MTEEVQPDVVLYTKSWCGFCFRAKSLLERHGLEYREIDVTFDPALEDEMIGLAGGRSTVPQIFVRGTHIGGSEELARLAASGELDDMLRHDDDRQEVQG